MQDCPCNSYSDFEERNVVTNKPPYVCNGCKKNKITLVKQVYVALSAHEKYQIVSESRSGLHYRGRTAAIKNIITINKQGQFFTILVLIMQILL